MKVKVTGLKSTISKINNLSKGNNKEINNQCKSFIENAVIGAKEVALKGFQSSDYAGMKDYTITDLKWSKNECSFEAQGTTILFQEFGTGITYGDLEYGLNYPRSKTSPTFMRGTYGKGKGSNPEGWVFVSSDDIQSKHTYPIHTKKSGTIVYKTKGNEGAKAMLSAYNYIKDFIDRGGKRW